MKIQVQIKSVYGNELVYPICDNAKLFASIKGQKTLTSRDLAHIKQLGYAIEIVHPAISL
jgi:hypothetical protein